MDKLGFSISEDDQHLLGTQFRSDDPLSLPNLVREIPEDQTGIEVESAYEITATDHERHLWIRCCECCTNNNHRRGVVFRFASGSRITVGRDCSRRKHDVHFENLIKSFLEREKRSGLVRQVVEVLEQLQGVLAFLHGMQANPAITSSREIREAIAHRLPNLDARLREAENGSIQGWRRVRDYAAETQRDERLDRKLDAAAQRTGRSRENAGVDQELLAAFVAADDPDASKTPLWAQERYEIHRFRGAGFYSVLPQSRNQANHLREQLLEVIEALRGKRSREVSSPKLQAIRKAFLEVLDKAKALHDEVAAALMFVDPTSMAALVQAMNRFSSADSMLQFDPEKSLLWLASSRKDTWVDVGLPTFELSATVLSKARQAVELALTEPRTHERVGAAA